MHIVYLLHFMDNSNRSNSGGCTRLRRQKCQVYFFIARLHEVFLFVSVASCEKKRAIYCVYCVTIFSLYSLSQASVLQFFLSLSLS